MNSKIKFSIFSMLAFASVVIIVVFSDNYLGVPFNIDLICLIFSFIEFVCICTACKVDERSLFCNEHKSVRYKKRTHIIMRETEKRIICVLLFSVIHYFIIMLIKKISLKDFALAVIFNFLTLLFLIIVQFFMEIKFNSDAGFFVTIALYIVLIFAGMTMYNYCQSYSDSMSELFEKMNKLNIANYSSLTRIRLMNCNVKQSLALLAGVDAIALFITLFGLKKSDIMERG